MNADNPAQPSLSYRDAGVDIEAGDALVERIKPFAKRTMRPEVMGGIGGFGSLFALPQKYRNPVLVSGTDGVGTKLKLAQQLGRQIGQLHERFATRVQRVAHVRDFAAATWRGAKAFASRD